MIALPAEIRRRRAASQRLVPLADGRSDPLDGVAVASVRGVAAGYGTYDVVTLGLACSHNDETCPAWQGVAS